MLFSSFAPFKCARLFFTSLAIFSLKISAERVGGKFFCKVGFLDFLPGKRFFILTLRGLVCYVLLLLQSNSAALLLMRRSCY